MKICYLSDAGSVHTKKWCNYFKDKGYDIEVISLNEGEIEGVKVHCLDIDKKYLRGNSLIKKAVYLRRIAHIKRLIHRIQPDILHAHYASSYGLLGSLCNYSPYILSVWGSDIYDFPRQGLIFKKIIEYNLKKADYIFSTSKAMAAETKLYTDKDIIVTPFGVDRNIFKKSNEKKDKNNSLIVIGTIKTLEKKYGIDYLIRAFAVLKERGYSFKGEIYGDGSERSSLQKLIEELNIGDRVTLGGYLKQDEVVEKFNSFDIGVFPSTLDSESFGVAAVEAQSCGLPLVVSDTPGLMEASNPGVTSLVARKKDYIDLAEKLEILIKDNQLRKQFGDNSIKYVEDNYDLNKNFQEVDSLYNELKKDGKKYEA